MSEEEDKGALPTPIAPLSGAETQDRSDVMEYYAYNAADRLKYVKEQIEEREKAHFNLFLVEQSLGGNPERGEHNDPIVIEGRPPIPCQCADCELRRIGTMMRSLTYAINKLKAVHASLT